MLTHTPPLTQLRARWFLVAASYAVALWLGYMVVRQNWHASHSTSWLMWAILALACQLGILWWGLQHNRRSNEVELLPTLGYGNGLTLTRGLALCLLAGFLFAPRPDGLLGWAPALLYAFSCIIDYLDGYVARITKHTTVLGEILDIEFDGLGMLIVIVLAIQYGQIPPWYLVLGLARQLFIFGIWLRKRWNLPVYEMSESDNRRMIAGFQMGFMSVVLWPVFEPPTTTLLSVLFAIPLAGSFLRDWFVVSGWIDADSARYQQARRLIKSITEGWLPLICRLVAVVVAILLLVRNYPTFANWATYLQQAEPLFLRWTLRWLAIVSPLALIFLGAGLLGRLAALSLIGLAMLDILATGFSLFSNGLLLGAAVWVLHMGSGYFAAWKPEEWMVRQRAGEQSAGEQMEEAG